MTATRLSHPGDYEKYGLCWNAANDPLFIELYMIKKGGAWKGFNSKPIGLGMAHHVKAAAALIWPFIKMHHWNELLVKEWVSHRYVGVMGPTNSGKTNTAAWMHLIMYYANPHTTTIIICSTTRERLEDRIWGEMKKLHSQAKQKFPWLPGNLLENKQRIITDSKDSIREGRDFRNGVVGVPCKQGGKYTGLGDFIGIKNKHVMLCGDELQLLPPVFIDSLSNVMKGPNRKVTGMGNPSDPTDSLGRLCEPAPGLNGWDGGIDQTPKSKSWETRWQKGICVQLCGSDTPNNATPEGEEPLFPFLISKQDMENDAKVWGVDDWHYTMFNEGRMPRGQGSRRVLTRNLCVKNHAMEDPIWLNANRIHIGFLDAAYRGTGGDRCVFGELQFGHEASLDEPGVVNASSIVNQGGPTSKRKQLLHLMDMAVIPITGTMGAVEQSEAEEQIVQFCFEQCTRRGILPENFFFDAGMRTTMVSAFARGWSNQVQPIDFGGSPSDRPVSSTIETPAKEYYSKFVTELWFSVRLIIEAGQFRGMNEQCLIEGCQREWKMVGNNKIEVETKKEMKEKCGASPDYFDALVCGVEGARRRGFIIQNIRSVLDKNPANQLWKTELREQSRKFWRASELTYN